ncbi:MAG: recombination mediator RecR [Patescibacteria group bacterium]|nr:recombination mediator RecR [Patescibacteria group bacterium]
MLPSTIQKFVELVAKFPSIGKRQAFRLAFYLTRNKEIRQKLLIILAELEKNIKICEQCFLPFEGNGQLCDICTDRNRKKDLICVVEKETDVFSIENTHQFKGVYHILGQLIDPNNLESYQKLHIDKLQKRIQELPNKMAEEIILALNPTTEGDLTAMYLERKLKNLTKKITRIGRGIPTGGEIEFADEETIKNALSNRQ